MKLFDTHTHIGLIHSDPIEQLIIVKEAKMADVQYMISICNNIRDFFSLYGNLSISENVLHAVGLSPSEVDYSKSNWESLLFDGIKKDRVVAIGEIGLDYCKKFGDKNSQIELFIKQLEIASSVNLPVIIHNREAGNDILEILKTKLPPKGAVMHCFSEDYNFAKNLLDKNVYFSFAGNLTYRNAINLHDAARKIPIEKIVIESEAPFMVPNRYKGKRNRPAYLKETLNFLAELKEMDVEECANIVYNNSLTIFNVK